MNYLRPDIKRGNFTQEEEDAIIRLHGSLGNKYYSPRESLLEGSIESHTLADLAVPPRVRFSRWSTIAAQLPGRTDNEIKNVWHTHLKKRARSNRPQREELVKESATPWRSCSELSSSTTTGSSTATGGASMNEGHTGSPPELLGMDEDDWWSEALSLDSSVTSLEFSDSSSSLLPFDRTDVSSGEDDKDFWMRVLMEVGGMPELPSF